MAQNQLGEKVFLNSKLLEEASVFHFFSTKKGWNGKTRFTGDEASIYQNYRKELADTLKLEVNQLVFPRQNHGEGIQIISENIDQADVPETDALITDKPNICLCVQTADCVPILLFDQSKSVIAAVHAGWRGTVNKILAETVQMMKNQFGSSPGDILAGIGPSISAIHYEVGGEVISLVENSFTNSNMLLSKKENGKALFNLWEANKTLLLDAGLTDNHIEVLGTCTYSKPDLFYSARRNGATTGRMVSGIMINQ